MTPRAAVLSLSDEGAHRGLGSGHPHCCPLASSPFLTETGPFAGWLGSLDSTPLFLVAAITLRVGVGYTQPPWDPLLRADARSEDSWPPFKAAPCLLLPECPFQYIKAKRHPVVQIKFLLWSGEGVQAWAWCQAAHSSLSLPRDEEDNVRLLIPGGNLSGSQ